MDLEGQFACETMVRLADPVSRQDQAGPTLLVSTPSDKIGEPIPTLEKKRYNPIMPKNRFLLSLTVAASLLAIPGLAQVIPPSQMMPRASSSPTAEAPERPLTEAEKALDASIETLRSRETAAASIEMTAEMLGQSFRVEGQYLKGPGLRSLINLQVRGLGDVSGMMQQVCDGTTFWDYTKVLDTPRLTKLTLAPMIEVLEKPEADETVRQTFLDSLGLAGPEAVLSGLRKSVLFDQMESGTLEETPVRIFRGRWTDRTILSLPGGSQAGGGDLPPYVPTLVTVWVGEEDGWPYQVQLEGRRPLMARDDRMVGPDGRPVGRKSSARAENPSKILLNYRKSEHQVRNSDFVFQQPPNVEVLDTTDQLVSLMKNQIAEMALMRRREAAGKADSKAKGADSSSGLNLGPRDPLAPGAVPSPETFRSTAPPR